MKQIIVVRRKYDGRKVRTGKLISQACHASLGGVIRKFMGIPYVPFWNSKIRGWLTNRFTKIAVYVDSENELLEIHEKAYYAGLNSYLIIDSGKTEFEGLKNCLGNLN